MEQFLKSNEWQWRLARTIVQGHFGCDRCQYRPDLWPSGFGPRLASLGRGPCHGRAFAGDGRA